MIKNKGRKTYHLFKYKHNLKPKKVKTVQDPLKNMKLTLKSIRKPTFLSIQYRQKLHRYYLLKSKTANIFI